MQDEIIKHSRKIKKVVKSPNHTLLEKLKEIAIEIAIIVFAVSISIWLHSWSEHRHEQKQVKSFLTGLRTDINQDIVQANELLHNFRQVDTIYTYLSSLSRGVKLSADSLKTFLPLINQNYSFRQHTTRFNGFISAGKILNIESDSLSLDILKLYQEDLPQVNSSIGGWNIINGKLNDYLADNVSDINNDLNTWQVITAPKGKYLTKHLKPSNQLFSRLNVFIKSGESIIRQIDSLYSSE